MNVYVLQVMSILRQAYCSPKYLYYLLPGQERKVREPDGSLRTEILVPDIEDFKKRWEEAIDALEKGINLLKHPQEFGAISSQYLPYVSILPAFAALQKAAREIPAERQFDAQRKIRHWYWASVFTNRYSGSVESTTARDFLDVQAWFENDTGKPALIAEFRERFRRLDLRREARRGTSVYNGIFNLLVLRGAGDWMTGHVPQYDDLDDHHIVPRSWGKGHALETSIDSILNRTPLTSDTNRNIIRDRLPNAYLPELIAANGEKTVRQIMETHLISGTAFDILLHEPFTPEDFEAFISERQKTIQEAIGDLLVKERFHLEPRLRDLDERLEKIELALRSHISRTLENDPRCLPSHVAQKIRERLQTAARKNPALDLGQYKRLESILEFADLRELEAIIVSKAAWARFADRFGSKPQLSTRFTQLAELRNSIRHSRTVTEIIRKDGEAALLWFEGILKR